MLINQQAHPKDLEPLIKGDKQIFSHFGETLDLLKT